MKHTMYFKFKVKKLQSFILFNYSQILQITYILYHIKNTQTLFNIKLILHNLNTNLVSLSIRYNACFHTPNERFIKTLVFSNSNYLNQLKCFRESHQMHKLIL